MPQPAAGMPQAPPSSSVRRPRIVDHRAEALLRTAPWLAGLGACCAAVVLWALAGAVPPAWLALWAALLGATGIVILRTRRRAAGIDDHGPVRSTWWCAGEAAVHAGLWSALPAFAFAGQPPLTQVMLGAAMFTMMAGAFLLAIVPLAAALWAIIIGMALLWGLHGQGAQVIAGGLALISAYSAVVIAGCLTLERLLARQALAAGDERARGEAIGLLLHEYEAQGAGWLWQTDAHHRLTYVSPRICDRLGRSTRQLIGQSLPMLLGSDERLGRALATREPFSALETRVAACAGGECWMAMSASPVIGPDGQFEGFRGLGTEVTEARRAQERIRRVALVDDLTGLPNRQRMRAALAEALEQGGGRGGRCALLYADLDGFKAVNDHFGHAGGDLVLRTIADRIRRVVGDAGLAGRLGGDGFAILLDAGSGRQHVEAIGRRLIEEAAAPVSLDGGGEARVGLSVGCVFAPDDGASVDELLARADIALYQAKSRGRGQLRLFDRTMQRDADERASLEADLRQALARKELRLDYQPVIDVETQAIVGFEALLRWAHPRRGLVPPAMFVPLAEECGLIQGIGEWVIRTACAAAAGWPGSIFVTVNISAAQLARPGLPSIVGEALVATRLQPARLELEVTERVFEGDSDGPLDMLRRLRALGVGIALDDFGRGHASLGYLNRTIFHTLKLDGGFVRDAAQRSETLSVLRATVALARDFGLDVTAEGIESFEDFARMKALGCRRVQGYLFGRPTTRTHATSLLSAAAARAAE